MSTYKELQNGSAYTFKNMSTGKMLNLYGGRTANGTNVCQYTADGSDDQKWTFFNDKLYAYPETSGNGYFLYYNKEYFSENDIDKLDTILDTSLSSLVLS